MHINVPARTLNDWGNSLTEAEMAVLQEYGDYELDDEVDPGEVLETLIEWYGGLATAFQVKQLIGRIYEVEL